MTQPDVTELSRKWKIRVNTGTVAVPAWVVVAGRQELQYNPHKGSFEDDHDHDGEGYTSKTKTMLENTATMKILRRKGPTTGVYDPGQEKLRTCAAEFGSAGVVEAQIYDRNGGAEAYQGFYEVEWTPDGGSTGDLEKITITLHGKGKPTVIANPEA